MIFLYWMICGFFATNIACFMMLCNAFKGKSKCELLKSMAEEWILNPIFTIYCSLISSLIWPLSVYLYLMTEVCDDDEMVEVTRKLYDKTKFK